jgi:hypothetical protein
MQSRVGPEKCGLGLGFCRPGCLCNKIIVGLGVRLAGLAPNPGMQRLGLLACEVKARARSGPKAVFVCFS